MNTTIRTGLLLVISVTSASACTSLLGGFDFDGKSSSTGTTGTGSGGSSGGMTSTSGTGGSGGVAATTVGVGGMTSSSSGAACSDPANDCAPTGNQCVVAICEAGVCSKMNVANHTLVSAGAPDDCVKQECDGNGSVAMVPNDAEIPNDAESCTTDTCAAGVPVHTPVVAGMACSENFGTRCGDASAPGACVSCNAATQTIDCPSQVCQSHKCVVASCGDNLKNNGESDKDCGGPNCGACIDGKTCGGNSDCLSQVCSSGICKVPTCADNKANGAETGTDCGNSAVTGCVPCPPSEGCAVPGDCASGVCTNKICKTPTCFDGVQNQAETDKDCGGPTCASCGFALNCGGGNDCATGYCIAAKCDAKTIATGQVGATGIVVDAVNVYWVTYISQSGVVMKAPINGGNPVAIATGQNFPTAIAIDTSTNPSTIFWSAGDQTIKRVSAAGGPITTMATGQTNCQGLAVNATTLFWTNVANDTVQKLASNVAGPTVPTQINMLSSAKPHGIALDAFNVYWANEGTVAAPATVIGASLSTGVNTQIYTGAVGMSDLRNLVIDQASATLFITDFNGSKVVFVGTTGSNPGTLTATPNPQGIAISGTTLYWSEHGIGAGVNKIGTNGVGKAVIASGQADPTGIALDSTSVYWTNNSDGTIKKANK